MADKQPKAKRSKKINASEHEQIVGELTQDLQRIQADFTNYKRRTEEDALRSVQIGKESVLRELLPTFDNITRALSNVPEELAENEYVKGVQSIAKQLDGVLAGIGLVPIDALGNEFDAELMEAVAMEDGEGDKEIVDEVLQPGYMFGDQVVRHAIVKVKKG